METVVKPTVEQYEHLVAYLLKRHLRCRPGLRPEYHNLKAAGMVALWQCIERYDGRVRFQSYAGRRIIGAFQDWWRQHKHWMSGREGKRENGRRPKTQKALTLPLDDKLYRDRSYRCDPCEETIKQDSFRERLRCLPERQREVFFKYFYEDKRVEDIAAEMNQKPATVWLWLREGKKRLKEQIK